MDNYKLNPPNLYLTALSKNLLIDLTETNE